MEREKNIIEDQSGQKEKKRLAILLVLLIGLVVIGGSYAFFTAVFTGVEEDTTITIGGGSLGIHMDGGNIITLSNIYPREEAWDTKKFTITGNNNTSLHMPYYLNLVVTENTFQSGSLTYTLASQNTSNDGAPLPSIVNQMGIPTGAGIHPLGGGTFDTAGTDMVHTYYLTFFFPSRGVAQNEDQGAVFNAHVGISGDRTYQTLRSAILIEHPIRARTTELDLTVVANNANRDAQEGLFQIEDEHGVAYFFRGTHALNNNVIFAGHQWKVLRVEGNGNIRMIYNGVCPDNQCTINGSNAGATTTIGSSPFNALADRNAPDWDIRHVGYMYGDSCDTLEECNTNINESTMKRFVENWFNENITGINRSMVSSSTFFCNDRTHNPATFGFPSSGRFGFNSRARITGEGLPTLICPEANDRFELSVGLITVDEFNLAGGRRDISNTDFFLRTGADYWTMSPHNFWLVGNADNTFLMSMVQSNGSMPTQTMGSATRGVRPVLSLDSGVTILSGDGSSSNPFIVRSN